MECRGIRFWEFGVRFRTPWPYTVKNRAVELSGFRLRIDGHGRFLASGRPERIGV